MIFIGNGEDCQKLNEKYPFAFYDANELPKYEEEIGKRIKAGENMIFASVKNLDFLKKIWVFSYEGRISEYAVLSEKLPHHFPSGHFNSGSARYLFFRAESSYAMHGVDEEPRAYVTPFLVNRNKYGDELGAVGLWINNYDKSLCGGHYKGGNWYILAVESLYSCMSSETVDAVLSRAAEYRSSRCYISRLSPEFAFYHSGERVRVDYTIENDGKDLQSAEIIIRCGKNRIKKDVALNPLDTCRGHLYLYPDKEGETIRAELFLHDIKKYGVERETESVFADSLETGILISDSTEPTPPGTPEIAVSNGRLCIDGKTDFFAGTHYYPCSDFFELSYRDTDVIRAEKTISVMKKEGIKICRIWADPVLDERSIRGMEAVLYLLAKHGIVAWITFFSSWVHYMEVHTQETEIVFEAADMKDEAFIGIIMQNIEAQKIYVQTLVRRWKNYRNIVWNLTNEFSVVDPPEDRVDFDWVDQSYKKLPSPFNSIAIFRQWAAQIHGAITELYLSSGSKCQPVVYGVSCWDTGSENYRCTCDADIIATHTYMDKRQARYHANLQNSSCIGKPFVVEEFGGVWRDYTEKAEEFHARFCTYLASGNDAAMSYEWGTSWVCDEISGIPPYMKFKDTVKKPEEADGFLYSGRHVYAASWPSGSISLCPWIASHEYGINYPNVNYESPVMRMTKRFSEIGRGLGFINGHYKTYLVLPFETSAFKPTLGYNRILGAIGKTFDALWNVGAKFQVWQTNALRAIPDGSVVIYPNAAEIPDEISSEFDVLKQRGCRVYFGNDDSFIGDPDLETIRFSGSVQVQVRNTECGELLALHTEEENPIPVEVSGIRVEIKNDGLLLFDKNGRLKTAEFCGKLEMAGETVVISGDRVAVEFNKPGSIRSGMRIIPFYTCEILVPGFDSYTILDDERIVDQLKTDGRIPVTPDTVGYSFRV